MAEIMGMADISRERIDELSEHAASIFRQSVLPIYGSTLNGNPEHIGSCIALRLDEDPYLLTAAHVLDWNKDTSLYVGHDELRLISMEFSATARPNGDRNADRFDFALGKIPDCDIHALSGVKFITENQIDRSVGYVSGRVYTSIGYPNSKNKKIDNQNKNVRAEPLQLTGIVKVGAKLAQDLGVSGEDHIFISQNAKYSTDPAGRRISAVRLNGMSGGAVINLGKIADPEVLAGCKNPTPLLAGLFIEFYKDYGTIVATKLDTILKARETMFP
jgi:hypothetical protein